MALSGISRDIRVAHDPEAEERGSLLLDSLVGISIVAIVFSIVAPNYSRATTQTKVASDAQQLQNVGTALELYANDHGGSYPLQSSAASLSSSILPASYMAAIPQSAIDATKGFNYQSSGTTYTITDNATLSDSSFFGSYRKVDGSACTACTNLNYDNVHGVYGS
jgi:type II secretory pathway pseudopilin PulG